MSANRTRRIFAARAARAAALLAAAAAVAGPGGCNEPTGSPSDPELSRDGFAAAADSVCAYAHAGVTSRREAANQLAEFARPAPPAILRQRDALVAALREDGDGRRFRRLARALGMHVCAAPIPRS